MSLTGLLVPNFVKFLEQHGEVDILDEIPEQIKGNVERFADDMTNSYRRSHQKVDRHIILLEGEFLGILDTYSNPEIREYYGKVPGFKTESNEENIHLTYDPEYPFRHCRIDCWKIPFP